MFVKSIDKHKKRRYNHSEHFFSIKIQGGKNDCYPTYKKYRNYRRLKY